MFTLLIAAGGAFDKTGAQFGEKSIRFGHGTNFAGGDGSIAVLFPLLHLITWVLLAVLLVALIRWIWAKGDKK